MWKLVIAVILCMMFMAVEVVGGIKANSLAILTDAAHLLSDVAAFAISLLSLWAAGWEATPRQSYGFFRVEIIGALISVQLIWLLAGILVYEAVERLVHGSGEVQGSLMFAVSAFGLLVNIVMAVLLGHAHGHGHDDDDPDHDEHQEHCHHHGHPSKEQRHHDIEEALLKHEAAGSAASEKSSRKLGRNINVHSAYLHVLGDSVQSIGVMIGGAVIWCRPEWKVVDLVCTLIFSAIVLLTTARMLRSILEVLMESTPREVDAARLEKGLCEMEGVVAVHELHIWAITVGKVLLACHVTIAPEADADEMLHGVIGHIRREYSISHVTVQIERRH